jgi:hypothetical protein
MAFSGQAWITLRLLLELTACCFTNIRCVDTDSYHLVDEMRDDLKRTGPAAYQHLMSLAELIYILKEDVSHRLLLNSIDCPLVIICQILQVSEICQRLEA